MDILYYERNNYYGNILLLVEFILLLIIIKIDSYYLKLLLINIPLTQKFIYFFDFDNDIILKLFDFSNKNIRNKLNKIKINL